MKYVPETEDKQEYDPNHPKPDLDKYDPKKSKLPDKSDKADKGDRPDPRR